MRAVVCHYVICNYTTISCTPGQNRVTQVTPILSFPDSSVFDFASLILLRNTSNQRFPINNLFLMAVCIILPMQNTHSESLLQCKVVGGFLVQICAFIFGYLYLFLCIYILLSHPGNVLEGVFPLGRVQVGAEQLLPRVLCPLGPPAVRTHGW